MPVNGTTGNLWRNLKLPALSNKSYYWYPSDNEDRYRTHGNHHYGVEDIIYDMNSYGYRSEEFTKDPAVLFIGCSNTVGIGLPLEETWSWRFKCMMENLAGRKLKYYNLAHGGKSMTYITRTLHLAKELINPILTVVLNPPPTRMEIFSHNILRDVVDPSEKNSPFRRNEIAGVMRMFDEQTMAYDTASFVSHVSGVVNSPFLWRDWSLYGGKLEHFNEMTCGRFAHNQCASDLIMDQKARDGMHPGSDSNEQFAKDIFNEKIDLIKEVIGK